MHQDVSLREELVAEVKAIAPVLVEHSSESERLGAWMLLLGLHPQNSAEMR